MSDFFCCGSRVRNKKWINSIRTLTLIFESNEETLRHTKKILGQKVDDEIWMELKKKEIPTYGIWQVESDQNLQGIYLRKFDENEKQICQ